MSTDSPLPDPAATVVSPISAVDALNRACFCFSLDQDALARALEEPPARATGTCDGYPR